MLFENILLKIISIFLAILLIPLAFLFLAGVVLSLPLICLSLHTGNYTNLFLEIFVFVICFSCVLLIPKLLKGLEIISGIKIMQ